VSPLDAGAYVLRCRTAVANGFREAGESCIADSDCRSGACGQLANGSHACFRSCDVAAASACPGALTCQAGAYRFTGTLGNVITLDGCAP
jgi:hypothetical protein